MAILHFLIFSKYLFLSNYFLLIFVYSSVYLANTEKIAYATTSTATTASTEITPPELFPKDTNRFKIIHGSKAPMEFPANTDFNEDHDPLINALLQFHKQSLEVDDLLHGGSYRTTPKILPQEKPDTLTNIKFYVSPVDQVELIENDLERTEDTKFSIRLIQARSSGVFTTMQKQIIVLAVLTILTTIGGVLLYLKIKRYSG